MWLRGRWRSRDGVERKRHHGRCFSLRAKIPFLSVFFFPRILMRPEKFGLTIKEQKQPTKTTLINSRQRSRNSALRRKKMTDRTFLFPWQPPATASLQLEKSYFFRGSSSKPRICRRGEPPPRRQGSRRRWRRRSDPDPASWPASAGTPSLTTLGSPVCNLHTSRDRYQTSQQLRWWSGHDRIILQPNQNIWLVC